MEWMNGWWQTVKPATTYDMFHGGVTTNMLMKNAIIAHQIIQTHSRVAYIQAFSDLIHKHSVDFRTFVALLSIWDTITI